MIIFFVVLSFYALIISYFAQNVNTSAIALVLMSVALFYKSMYISTKYTQANQNTAKISSFAKYAAPFRSIDF